MARYTSALSPDAYDLAVDLPTTWELTTLGSKQAVFEAGDYQLTLTGSGFAAGDTPKGTITGMTLSQLDVATTGADAPKATVLLDSTTTLSLSFAGLVDAIANTTFTFAPIAYLMQGNDTVAGTKGDDALNGYAGSDTLSGGDGNDRLWGDRYAENADAANDILDGGAGNDRLDGGLGNDTMTGGTGDDYYVVTEAKDKVIETKTGGSHDRVLVSNERGLLSYTLAAYVENADVLHQVAGGDAPMAVSGNALANKITSVADFGAATGTEQLYGLGGNDRLYASDGNDLLDGGTGRDVMIGGTGSDTYVVDDLKDSVRESVALWAGDTDVDTVQIRLASAVTVSLGGTVSGRTASVTYRGIEAVELGTASSKQAHVGIGSTGNDGLTGNAGANLLYGLGGDDTLRGGAGNDTLTGGTGADTLTGGSGADKFVYASVKDSGGSSVDTITDFRSGDKIDLSAVDANAGTGGVQHFSFIGSAEFDADATGQLRFADGVLSGSTDADATAEFSILLSGVSALGGSDLVLG